MYKGVHMLTKKSKLVLIIEEDPFLVEAITEILTTTTNIHTLSASDTDRALSILKRQRVLTWFS